MRFLSRHPTATAVLYVLTGTLPLYLISAQFAALQRELGLSTFRLGVVTAVYFGLAAVAATPCGWIVHRFGARAGLRTGAALAATANVAALCAGAWWWLFVAAGVAGMANAAMQVSTSVVLAREANYHRQGISFGAKQGAIPMSSMVAGALLPVVGVAMGWRWPFALAGVYALVMASVAPAVGATRSVTALVPDRPWSVSPGLRWLAIGGACGGAAGNALSLFFVASAVALGAAEHSAGTGLALASGLVVVVRLLIGWVADRTNSTGHREMIVALALGTLGCVAIAMATSIPVFYLGIGVALLGSWGWPGLAYFTAVRIHPEAPARASGVLLSGNLTGTVAGPAVVGMLAANGTYRGAWIFCAALSLAATTSMAMSLWHTRSSRRARTALVGQDSR